MSSSAEEQYEAIQAGLNQFDEQETEINKLEDRSRRAKIGSGVAALTTLAGTALLIKTAPSGEASVLTKDITGVLGVGFVGFELLMGFIQSEERHLEAGKVGDKAVQKATELGIDAPSWAFRVRRKRDKIEANKAKWISPDGVK